MLTTKINKKSISRIAAIQTTYQFEQNMQTTDITILLVKIKEFYKDTNIESDYEISKSSKIKLSLSYHYLNKLVRSTHKNLKSIDQNIEMYLTNQWNLIILPKLLIASLRVALCELEYFPNTPSKVIINEYTDIANNMLDSKEVGFVNSVLDKYASKCRGLCIHH